MGKEEEYSRREFLRRARDAGIMVGTSGLFAGSASLAAPLLRRAINEGKLNPYSERLSLNPYPSPYGSRAVPEDVPAQPSLFLPASYKPVFTEDASVSSVYSPEATPMPSATPDGSPLPTPKPIEIVSLNAPEIVWRGDPTRPYVYLTVDDCYYPDMVIKAMDAADRYGIKLTFFPIGTNVEKFPEVFREAYLRGHALENHTYTHEWLDGKSASNIEYQILKQHEVVQKAIGKDYKQHFLRPPGGEGIFSDEHPWPLLWETARKLGYKIAMWTADSNGWRKYPSTDRATINYIMENINEYFFKGSIVLQHAISDDMIALPLIIAEALKRRWIPITMPRGIH